MSEEAGATGGGSDPGAAAGAAGGGASPESGGSAVQSDWLGSAAPEVREFVTKKGWKGASDVIQSYQNAEKKLGASPDQLLRKPDWSKPESVAEFRKAFGAPDDVEKYQHHEVKLPSGEMLDANAIAKVSHKLGLPQEMHAQLLDAAGELLSDVFKAEETRLAQVNEKADSEARAKHGARWSEMEESAKATMEALEVDDQFRQNLGILLGSNAAATEWLAEKAKHFAEKSPADRSNGAGNRQMVNSPEAALARKEALKADKAWRDRFYAGDQEAKAEWERINHLIAQGRMAS